MLAYTVRSYCLLPDAYQEYLANKDGVALNTVTAVSASLPEYLGIVDEVSELLKRSLVSDTIAALTESPSIASWVQQGLELHDLNVLRSNLFDFQFHNTNSLTSYFRAKRGREKEKKCQTNE